MGKQSPAGGLVGGVNRFPVFSHVLRTLRMGQSGCFVTSRGSTTHVHTGLHPLVSHSQLPTVYYETAVSVLSALTATN